MTKIGTFVVILVSFATIHAAAVSWFTPDYAIKCKVTGHDSRGTPQVQDVSFNPQNNFQQSTASNRGIIWIRDQHTPKSDTLEMQLFQIPKSHYTLTAYVQPQMISNLKLSFQLDSKMNSANFQVNGTAFHCQRVEVGGF